MKKGDKLFVRIDCKNSNSNFTSKDFEEHEQYLKTIASERYFMGGGFINTTGTADIRVKVGHMLELISIMWLHNVL